MTKRTDSGPDPAMPAEMAASVVGFSACLSELIEAQTAAAELAWKKYSLRAWHLGEFPFAETYLMELEQIEVAQMELEQAVATLHRAVLDSIQALDEEQEPET
jgi:hypothetical protein